LADAVAILSPCRTTKMRILLSPLQHDKILSCVQEGKNETFFRFISGNNENIALLKQDGILKNKKTRIRVSCNKHVTELETSFFGFLRERQTRNFSRSSNYPSMLRSFCKTLPLILNPGSTFEIPRIRSG
jgi:hypothetical protein